MNPRRRRHARLRRAERRHEASRAVRRTAAADPASGWNGRPSSDPIAALHARIERNPMPVNVLLVTPWQRLEIVTETVSLCLPWAPYAVVSALRGIVRAYASVRVRRLPVPSPREAIRRACRALPGGEGLADRLAEAVENLTGGSP